ncbi:carboxyltransferase subunit alpha [Schleiferilactobacillus perolens]|jgi:acetyl-CoA carboxylase carboxyl transferase subunit alpha|uniref:acetyl-CoA carboxytransferase n=1 Tax=Schleiferilactobacillus perolens DSM 12744 TaxID=1423792 RepID=A0A0R1MYP4_9LACO|nr:carboxyltransferase subunit alpha [Schleiferilactobacillus perolens]KRL11124.1 acetyl-CoA carboxylase [Schleiferilactobacillus perolens DSM 12744]MCI1891512.1 acetyl-CoA carboxylase carboxyl transferase subunit alpha [Schleiferilactobacillus harbinensis]MCI1911928.1 acetyl-CoA carboxylase carboxyl transferase subunit alpha [Schleiferilactobacillus harbinensis]MCI2170508.1 acetyl-CoA carboxylase carboxyl transferase subunit alpha [Schleiferilactobacillus perolens]
MVQQQDAFAAVKAARSTAKIPIQTLIDDLVTDFFPLHGDRAGGDDPAMIGGIGQLREMPVTIVGIQKGTNTQENIDRHFGSALPEGYRKSLRLMKEAAKFHRPVLALINTPGAFPDKHSEDFGQGEAIARSLLEGMQLPTPILSIIVGEGGSGGALALACGDEVWMFEHSTYAILSPEGYASIMWKDAAKAPAAAAKLGLTPKELLAEHVVDRVITEVTNQTEAADLATAIHARLTTLLALPPAELLTRRQARYRKF